MKNSEAFPPTLKKGSQSIVILDKQGYVLDTNENGSFLFGAKRILTGRHLSDFIANKSQADIIAWLKLVKMGSDNVLLIKLNEHEESDSEISMQGTYSSLSNSYICMLSELDFFNIDSRDSSNVDIEETEDMSQFLDKDLFQSLMDEFYKLTGIPIGVLDLSGNILVAEGWQDICTKYHRIHPETCANCLESDVELTKGIQMGEFREYKCKNNMWDVATPIYIGGKRKGHIFLGQFFYDDETVDVAFFRKQAEKYGFNEKDYLAALENVPRFSRQTIQLAMSFYAKLAVLVAELSYTNAKLGKAVNVLRDKVTFEQSLMDSIPSPIFYKDSDCVYRGCNRAFEEFLGVEREQLIGKTVYEISEEKFAKVYDEADRNLLKTQEKQIYEASATDANGKTREILFHKATFEDSFGRLAGIIGIMLDITNRKKIEMELIEARNSLEQQVEERTSELTAANEELLAMNEELKNTLDDLKKAQNQLIMSEKMAALGSLVAGIAHEISTPLGIGVTSVSYIEHEMVKVSRKYSEGTMLKHDFEDFLKDANAMMKTIAKSLEKADQLLSSFRMIAIDQTNNEWRVFNAAMYTRDLLCSLEPLLKSKDCKTEVVCPDILEIKGYPGVFAQIITNLVNNSVVHAFDDVQGTIRIVLEKNEGKNYLYFSDNGSGMTEEVQKRAFDPFFTTKRGAEGGTGLGLHLVYNLVIQKLGGTISMESKVGIGTRFEIIFPDYIPDHFTS